MRLKKYISFFCCAVLLVLVCSSGIFALDVSAQSAVVIEATTGKVLYAKNENEKRSMASTTKIMTSLLVAESGLMNGEITVTAAMLKGVEGTNIGLKTGDRVSVETLVYGMLLESGNDAANVAACAVSGSIQGFVGLMNAKAKELGMNSTSFETPSGLDGEAHYSTAYDMAVLGAYAIKNPTVKAVCSTKSYTADYGTPSVRHTFSNHNRLLSSYEGAIGLKTGFTKKSGRCLVSVAQRGGVTLVAVTLNAPNDWQDHKKMLDYGFSCVSGVNIECDLCYNVSVVSSEEKTVEAVAAYGACVPSCCDVNSLEKKVTLKRFEYAPIEKGDVLGCVSFVSDGVTVCQIPLVAKNDVFCNVAEQKPSKTFAAKIKDILNSGE